jgi:hypothetical protein
MLTRPLTVARAAAALEEANRKLVVELFKTGGASAATRDELGRAMLAVVAADLAGGLVGTRPARPGLEPGLDRALLVGIAAGLAVGAAATDHEGSDMLTGNQERARKSLSRRQIGGHVCRLSAALRGERG